MKTIEISKIHAWAAITAILLVIGAGSYGVYRYYALNQTDTAQIGALTQSLTDASSTNAALNQALIEEQARNDSFASEISTISGTVGTLDKLSKIDPELLAKYSKVYFLNENYVPSSLSDIPSQYTYDDGKTYQFLTPVLPHLEDLMNAAKSDGLSLEIISAYRSFGTQAVLKSEYTTTYGSGADTFSADQGYSEHQLGTAIDFTTPTVKATFTGFEKTDEYSWLVDNAYKYGFILSYPPNNAYYIYEPWHWRYVGVALATKLHEDNEYFYDADQREINTYLVNIFD